MSSLDAISAAATGDEWEVDQDEGRTFIRNSPKGRYVAEVSYGLPGGPPEAKANAALIVALVNAYREGRLVEMRGQRPPEPFVFEE